jgi:hypothetical protein
MAERPPLDVERVWIREFALVAVGRAEGERDLVAGTDGLAVQGRVARGGALEALSRRIEAQRFLDRRRDQRRIRDKAAPGVGIVVQIEREHAHEARERFHAGHHEGRRGEHDFALGQSVAVDLSLGEVRDQIVGRIGSARSHFRADSNKKSDIVWNEETFKEYIEDPSAKIPGTKKIFAGIKSEQEITDLWVYLKRFDAAGNIKK